MATTANQSRVSLSSQSNIQIGHGHRGCRTGVIWNVVSNSNLMNESIRLGMSRPRQCLSHMAPDLILDQQSEIQQILALGDQKLRQGFHHPMRDLCSMTLAKICSIPRWSPKHREWVAADPS